MLENLGGRGMAPLPPVADAHEQGCQFPSDIPLNNLVASRQ